MMIRKVVILGSTGSVGANTLDVIRQHPEKFEVVGLACGQSVDAFVQQIREFKPRFVSVGSSAVRDLLQTQLGSEWADKIFVGVDGHADLVSQTKPDVVMGSMSGTYGLVACLRAIEENVAVLGLANKEVLVMAGPFVSRALKKSRTKLIPVDSEHSAIFQGLMGNSVRDVKHIILTASGGPFRLRDRSSFSSITKAEALKHPNWSMGSKITVDSATMMNKGLEYIEALRLFDVREDQVQIIIHPESIVHSLVEFVDGSIMAQLGLSDMRIPIALALAYPERIPLNLNRSLRLAELGKLHFEDPDFEKFECLKLAIESVKIGDHGPVVLNAANEIAVARFLNDELSFVEIPQVVESALRHFDSSRCETLEEVLSLDSDVKHWSMAWKPGRQRLSTTL